MFFLKWLSDTPSNKIEEYKVDCLQENLPTELIIYIFSFLGIDALNQASLVCRDWKRLSDDDLLYRLFCNSLIKSILSTISQNRREIPNSLFTTQEGKIIKHPVYVDFGQKEKIIIGRKCHEILMKDQNSEEIEYKIKLVFQSKVSKNLKPIMTHIPPFTPAHYLLTEKEARTLEISHFIIKHKFRRLKYKHLFLDVENVINQIIQIKKIR